MVINSFFYCKADYAVELKITSTDHLEEKIELNKQQGVYVHNVAITLM